MLGPDITVGDEVEEVLGLLHREVAVVGDLCLAGGRVLRGDEDDSVRGPGSVDGGGGGVLQDGDTLDVVRVDHRGVGLDTVHEDEGASTVDGAGTTDVEVSGTSRLTVGQGDVEVRNRSDQHLGQVGAGTAFEGFSLKGLDGTGKVDLLLGSITDNDSLGQRE